jgi:hypothetical protein
MRRGYAYFAGGAGIRLITSAIAASEATNLARVPPMICRSLN